MHRSGRAWARWIAGIGLVVTLSACGDRDRDREPRDRREGRSRTEPGATSARPAEPAPRPAKRADAARRPNILFVLADDQRADTLACMPKLSKLLQARGTTFQQNFATTPLCCPGRASILTGKYAHNHGVLANGDLEDEGGDASPGAIDFRDNGNETRTVAGWLQGAGYRTAYFGKYLNAYDKLLKRVPRYVPPHWDEWRAFSHAEFFDFDLVERGLGETEAKVRCYVSTPDGDRARDDDAGGKRRNARERKARDKGPRGGNGGRRAGACVEGADEVVDDGRENYSTDVLRDQAIAFLRKATAQGAPWFVHLAVKAPHGPFLSPARYQPDRDAMTFSPEAEARLAGCSKLAWRDRPPSYLEADRSDKPDWVQRGQEERLREDRLDRVRRGQLASVLATEDALEAIAGVLGELGIADETIVVYTGDNGYAWGEHGHTHKNCAYEECSRVPLVVLDPRVTGGPRTVDAFTLNVDLAPTFADWAGASVPGDVNGRSLRGLVDGTAPGWPRKHVLTECWGPGTGGRPDTHAAVRDARWKYVEHYDDPKRTTLRARRGGGLELELYDLAKDPYELDNLLGLSPEALAATGHSRAEIDAKVTELDRELERLKAE